MSNAIDSKVVEMKFDNRDFEANVKNSLSTLDKLKQALNFKGSVKGLNAIDDASKKVNFDGMASGINRVRVGFSAMEVAGMTVISNLTSQAMQLSSSLANMFVFNPPRSGFAEYEEYLGSIQTIQAGTGASIQEINSYLDELNTYADKTIYSFSDMTASIGKFTNAGVDLKTAVKAIQGISNEAAVSGANTEMASRAMYNFSQALSAGYVKLIDWKSIENANMATKEFKQQLIDTAVQLGTIVEVEGQYKSVTKDANGKVSDLFDSTKNFNDSLSSQWMTTEVLTTTLGRYSDETTDIGKKAFAAAQDVRTFSMMMDTLVEAVGSGWTATWRLLVGDFDEAKSFWTEMTNFFSGIIEKSADARNALLKGALTDPVEGLKSALTDAGISMDDFQARLVELGNSRGLDLQGAIDQAGSLEQAMRNGAITGKQITDVLDQYANETSNVVDQTDELNEKLEHFQQVVDDVWFGKYSNGSERYQALADAGYDYAKVQDLVNKNVDGHRITLEDLGEEQMKSIGYTDDEIAKFKELSEQARKSGSSLNEYLTNLKRQKSGRDLLVETIQTVRNSVANFVGAIKGAWTEVFGTFTSSMLYNIIQKLHDLADAMKVDEDRADKLKRIFKGVLSPIKALATIIQRVLNIAFKQLSNTMDKFDIDILGILANVGDAVVAFSNWITSAEAMTDVTDKLQNGLDWLNQKGAEFLDWLKSLPLIGDIISNVESALSNLGGTLKSLFDNFKGSDGIAGAFDGLGASIQTEIESGLRSITDGTIFDAVIDGLIDAKDKIGELLGSIVKTIVDAGNDLMNGAKDFDSGPIMTFAAGLGILAGLYNFNKKITAVANMIETLEGPVAAFTNVLKATKGAITQFGNLIKAAKQWTQAGAIMTVALSIVMVCGAIALLAQIPVDQLLPAVAIVGAVTGILIALMVAMTKLGKVAKVNTKMFVSMAAMLGVFTLALVTMIAGVAILGNMDGGKVAQGIFAMLGVITLISVLFFAVLGLTKLLEGGKSQIGMVKQLGRLMMELGVTMLLISASVAIMGAASQEGFDRAAQMIGYVAIFLLAIIGLTGLIGKAKGITGSQIYGIGKMFTSVGVMMLAMAAAIAIMSAVPEDGFDKAIKLFDRVMAFVFVLTVIAAAAPKGAAAATGVAGLMAGVGVAMIAMAASMRMIGSMSQEDIDKAMDVIRNLQIIITELMLVGAVLSIIPGKATTNLLTLVGMVLAVAGLAAVVVLLGMIPPETLVKGTLVVAALGAVLSVMGHNFQNIDPNTYKSILAAAACMAVMAVLVAALSFMDWDTALLGCAKLGLFVIVFGAAMKVLSWATGDGLSKKALVTIGVMLGVVTVLSLLIAILSGCDPVNAIGNAASIGVLIIVMTASIAALSKVDALSGEAIVSLLAMTVIVTMLAGLVALLSLVNADGILPKIASISLLLITMTGVIAAMSAIGPAAAGAEAGLLMLGAFATGLIAFLAILGVLCENIQGFEGAIEKGLDVLVTISGKLGEAIGSFIGGIGVGLSEQIVEIGDNLSRFGVALMPFVTSMKMVDSKVSEGVGYIAEALVTLSEAKLGSGFLDFFGGGWNAEDLATKMTDIGKAVAAFGTEVANIDASKVSIGAQAAVDLTQALADMPHEGGWFDGSLDLGKFKDNVISIGEGIMAFQNQLGDNFNPTIINSATRSLSEITDMIKEIPTEGGVAGFFMGSQNISGFADNLEGLGTGLAKYAAATSGITTDGISDSIEAGNKIIELVKNLPNTGGGLQMLTGEVDVASFRTNLAYLASGIANYSNIVAKSEINLDAINNSVEGLKVLGEFCKTYLSGFSADGGAAFKSTLDQLGKINVSDIITAFDSSQDLAELSGRNFMAALFRGIRSMVDIISTYCSGLGDQILSAINSGDNGSFFSAGLTCMGDMSNGMQQGFSNVVDSVGGMLENAGRAAEGRGHVPFDAAGRELMQALADGFQNGVNGLNSAISTALESAASTARRYQHAFWQAGRYCAEGFAGGIRSGRYMVSIAGQSLGSAALIAAKKAVDSNSPSKEFYKLGIYSGEGLSNGLEKSETMVSKSATGMANSALDAVSYALSSIGTMDGSNVKIKPVLDFNNMSKYGGSLDFSAAIGGVISSPINNNSRLIAEQMYQSTQIGKKLDKLRKEVAEISKPTYNVGGITYDDGSNVATAVRELTRAVKVERRK